jgi:hypothetical protein
MAREGMFREILESEVSPDLYLDGRSFALDYQAVSFLKKYPLKGTSLDPRAKAYASFLEAEADCALTNQRFVKMRREGFSSLTREFHAVLHSTVRVIDLLLGEFSCEEAVRLAKLGPGATMSHGGTKVSAYNKLTGLHSVTTELSGLGTQLISCYPGFSRSAPLSGPVTVPGNKLSFVPKTAKTDRCIAIEPSINIYLQLGAGRHMSDRLRRNARIDLSSQADRNRDLARLYSLSGKGVTIDLSSASDTISYEVVKELLPPDWFRALDLLRSRRTELPDGTILENEKFSSMGNGFTFPLETVIFYGITRACAALCEDYSPIAVFGDDIICGQSTSDLLLRALSFFGFKCNLKKTFTSGCFRESCGKDYWCGTDVRPYFLKKGLQDARDYYALANGIRRVASRWNHGLSCDSRLHATYRYVVSCLPKPLRIYVPDGYGDDCGLVENFDQASASSFVRPRKSRDGWEGWFYATVTSSPVKVRWEGWYGGLNTLLYLLDLRDTDTSVGSDLSSDLSLGGYSTLRQRGQPKLNAMAFCHSWPDLGPWERIQA